MPLSPYPSFEVPKTDLWTFLFERNDRPYPDDKKIYTDPYANRSYTYADVKSTAIEFGKGIRTQWGWQKGDVLALFTPNCIDTPAITWGTLWAGGIVSPANPTYTADELAFQLKDSGAAALVTQLPFIEIAKTAAKQVGLPEDRIILIGDQKDTTYKFKHFTSIKNTSGTSRYRKVKIDPEKDLAFLVYSSGTTGKPKGVMLIHRNITSNVLMNSAVEGTQMTWQEDKLIAFLPFFHIYGLTTLIHQSLYSGYELVVMPKFDLEGFCKIVQDHKITFGMVVPPVVLGLSKHPVVDKYDLSSLKMMNSGAAPLTKDLVDACYARLKVPVKQGYGLSETSPTTHAQEWDDWQDRVGSVGKLLPNLEAKYMSAEEKEVPAGETGELWIRGPSVFVGYLNNAQATKDSITPDSFFRTGDVGYQTKDGHFYITDRIKELIKYKGFQVPPAEVEGYLLGHPKISDVAVIGIFDKEQATEVPRAYVVLKQGESKSDETSKEIADWLSKRVAQHKRLRGGVRFVDEIPKSVAGKILRRVLKEAAKKEDEEGGKAKL